MALWDERDEPVLRWVSSLPPTFDQGETVDFATRDPVVFPAIAGLDTATVHASLLALSGEGLIDGRYSDLPNRAQWWDLRVTARGLQLLDEWPDIDRAIIAVGLDELLEAAAAHEDDPDARRELTEGAAAVGRLGGEVVKGAWTSVAQAAGKELSGG